MARKYTVIITPEDEGGFSVHVPALPGCTSQGETVKEALASIEEAIELYVESLKDEGLPIPEDKVHVLLKKVKISI